MTLTIYLIPDVERFLKLVQGCCGEVTLRLPDKTVCNLKENAAAQQILKLTAPKRDGLKLSFSDSNDTLTIMRYLAEAARR